MLEDLGSRHQTVGISPERILRLAGNTNATKSSIPKEGDHLPSPLQQGSKSPPKQVPTAAKPGAALRSDYQEVMKSLEKEMLAELRESQENKHNQIKNFLFSVEKQKMNKGKLNLGLPSSRQDAVLLRDWYENIMVKLDEEGAGEMLSGKDEQVPKIQDAIVDSSREERQKLKELTLNIAIKEICRQVSVHCLERGGLLVKLFDQFFELNAQA